MNSTDIDHVIDEAANLVTGLYIFPELGERLGALLRSNAAAGRYHGADGPESLAALVTADLQSLNGDLHLRLLFHADEVPDLPGPEMVHTMIAEEAARTLGGVAGIRRLDGNVAHLELGPLLFPPSIAGDVITAAMRVVAGAAALILDLRGTRGGDPAMVKVICGYLFDEPVHLIDLYHRKDERTEQSWSQPYVPGPRFGATKPVYVLTSATTFSGGEELAYDLQQLKRATVVGERTRGGAHAREGYRVHPHLEVTIPVVRGVSPVSGTNWEGVGVEPDIAVSAEEALRAAHRLATGLPWPV
ncbi:S41 family peptidase [Actinoplanes sp. NPDC051851]|uniref:S41 family peptidase n=1 Tax=Actinoplanes sp. NPDC051851 TaxID=3154753 RepID=UPI00342A4665